jgi:hypothetical protein
MHAQSTQNISLLPTKSVRIFIVGLRLDFQTRYIGKLDKAGDGTFISVKRSEKHLFQKLNAIGINLELLERFKFKWILVPYCGRKLWTSRMFLLQQGKVYSFGKKGFEPQCFLPVVDWDYEKAKSFESNLFKQGCLFGEAA